jgi:signal transduction histidine kinase
MLNRLRIRQKLGVLLSIPLIAVALVMSAFTVQSIANASAYRATAETALAARDIGGLIQALQEERLLAVGYLVVPSMERSAIVGQSRAVAADTALLATQPRTSAIIARAKPQLDALERARSLIAGRVIDAKEAYDQYRSAIFAVTESLDLANPRVADAEGLRQMLALDSLMRSNEEASSEGAIVVGAAVDPAFDAVLLNSVVAADRQHLRRFRALVPPDAYGLVDAVETGQAAARLREHIVNVARGGRPTPTEVSQVLSAALTYTGLRRLAQDRFARDTALGAQGDANTAAIAAAAVGTGAAVLFFGVLALAITVGRSISRPLRRLGRAVATVAELSRTELVRVVDSETLDVALPDLASVEVDSHDEIGDLAAAVNRVQATAAEMLERQATARANVSTMFANVSRRTQNLVGRQLSLIEELTRQATDAATREQLSQLEHVTTRLRRSADSLLVISGTIDQQFMTTPVRLTDVIDGALLEIEGFGAVEVVQPVPDVAVPAELASDLRLLIAELLENATNLTPPGSSVRIGATHDQRSVGPGYAPDCVIAVVDNGLGMSPAKLEEENRRLVERERLDVAPTRMLGLFVVGRLARRHGLSVRLDPSPGRGVTATVRVPARLVTPGSVVASIALGAVPKKAVAALESANRSGPFPWLQRPGPAAIGAAPVRPSPVGATPMTAQPASSGGPIYDGAETRRLVRDPGAERDAVNAFVAGVARAAGEGTATDDVQPADIEADPDPRPTPAERHQ